MADNAGPGVLVGKRVLIVEDEALITMLFEDMLADFGCEMVGPAMTLAHALDIAGSAEIDVAVLDLNLAGESSVAAAEVLQARSVPIVFSTGYGAAGLPPLWQDRPTLPKPFTSDDVAKVLSDALKA